MNHNHQSRAYPAGAFIPRRWRDWWPGDKYRRGHSTTTINTTEKHQHTKKSRQYFAREIRETLGE